jgi:hypothetical protein
MPAKRTTNTRATNTRATKPKQFVDASGDFLAFVEDVKRKDTRAFMIGDRTFHLRGPALLSDAEVESFNADREDVVAKARLAIDDYDGFAAAGGTAMMLMKYYDSVFNTDAEGEEPASSSS